MKTIGILIILAAIASFVVPYLGMGIKPIKKKISFGLLALGLVLAIATKLFFFADRGNNYLLVYPTGKLDAVMVQGIKWRGFAKIDEWQKWIDVKVVAEGDDIDTDEIEGIMKPVGLRFIDQVTATGFVSLRFQLPNDKASFIKLAVKYRTMSNLISNTIVPTAKEQLTNTAYMFAAQDYISGEAQSFRQTYEDMLENGTFAVEKFEHKDTVYSEIQQNKKQREIAQINTRYEVIKVEKNGVPVRIPHELSENNIIVSQVIVDEIDLEAAFKTRLEKQRDESAKRQLEQQKVKTAKDAQARILAEGERDKSAERVAQEKEQVKKLIAIETKLKEEATNKELAQIQLETERLLSQKKKVAADATYYENAKLVQAGLTPQERAEWNYKTSIGVAAEIAKLKFPSTMIIGGDDKGGTPIEALIGAAMAKQLTTGKKN